jgi:hypothetical protein
MYVLYLYVSLVVMLFDMVAPDIRIRYTQPPYGVHILYPGRPLPERIAAPTRAYLSAVLSFVTCDSRNPVHDLCDRV